MLTIYSYLIIVSNNVPSPDLYILVDAYLPHPPVVFLSRRPSRCKSRVGARLGGTLDHVLKDNVTVA